MRGGGGSRLFRSSLRHLIGTRMVAIGEHLRHREDSPMVDERKVSSILPEASAVTGTSSSL